MSKVNTILDSLKEFSDEYRAIASALSDQNYSNFKSSEVGTELFSRADGKWFSRNKMGIWHSNQFAGQMTDSEVARYVAQR